ncbi:hypothetical protein [Pseudoxanthomonas sp.]|jgi:hypothetical protein|uniref:hypothetical protein n=1 Tax=Pseudoxanthomonas sp. TaxID=1871049 RepID=UPI002FE2F932
MPNIDPAVQAAADRAVRRAHAQATQPEPQRTVLSEALLEERCCDHGPESPEDPALRAGRSVRAGSKNSASKIQTDVRRTRQNPTENAARLEIAAGELARNAAQTQLAKIDETIELFDRRIRELDAEVDSLLQPPSNEFRALAPEIRSYLRGLSERDRDDLLSKTTSKDYYALMYAVASAPAWMSGVAEGQKMDITTTILALKRPQLLSMPKAYKRERELLARCRAGFEESINEMVDFEAVDALRSLAGGA